MAKIYALRAREILDGRGWPTIELVLWLDNGFSTVSTVPTPISISKLDAIELRDGDNRVLGLGVKKAIDNINNIIAPHVIGKEITAQREIDQILISLDGTPQKGKLGANAILAISQAVLKAGALSVNLELYDYIQKKYKLTSEASIPDLIITALDGGVHGGNNLDFREFFILPASNMSLEQSLDMAVVFKQKLEELLVNKGAIHSVGVTGGYSPNLYKNVDAFELLIEAIKTTSYSFAQDIFFGLNSAAQDISENGKYRIRDNNQGMSASDLVNLYKIMRENYKLIYLEDPFAPEDHKQWDVLQREIGDTTTIASGHLTASRVSKIQEVAKNKLANAIVIKPKQVGTISETMESIKAVKDAGLNLIISHSSGETLDTLIVDLAVGVGANHVKFGPINRGERIAKYNRLTEIAQMINS